MKIGTPVQFTRRNGEVTKGKVAGPDFAYSKGAWTPVNTSTDPKVKTITNVRPSKLTKV
jgi:hypothetical protein